MKWSVEISDSSLSVYLALIATIVFVVDVHLPLGIAMAVPYVTVVALSLIQRKPDFTLIWAMLCTVLTLIGYYFSPLGNDAWFAVFNRLITLYAIWIVTFASIQVMKRGQADSKSSLEEPFDLDTALSNASDYTSDSIAIIDEDGSICSINTSFSRLFGYSLHDAKGKNISRLLQGKNTDITEVKRVSEAIEHQHAIESQLEHYHKNGHTYWVELSVNPIFNNEKLEHLVCIQRDITKQKQLEQALEAKVTQANLATQAKTQLMHLISSELTKPTQDLDKLAQKVMLSEELDAAQKLGKQVAQSSRLLQASLNYVIKLAHLDNEEITPHPQRHNISSYILHKKEVIEGLARGNGLTLESKISLPDHCQAMLDESLIDTIIDFFALSAVSQLQGGKLRFESGLSASNQISANKHDQLLLVCFTFEDNGVISKQLSLNDQTATNAGTLDQSIHTGYKVIEKVLKAVIGDISYSLSKSGHTQIDLQLPITVVESQPPAQATQQTQTQTQTGHDAKILIAEDNKVNYIVLAKLLNKLGYENIDHAEDGVKAVEKAKEKQYDVILMDHHMPNMTGLDATDNLLNQLKITSKVIACTADLSPQVRSRFIEVGATDVIYKPVKKETLLEALSLLTTSGSDAENSLNNKGVA